MTLRRSFLASAVGLASYHAALRRRQVVRIGYQKYGNLILLKAKGSFEEKLKPLGWSVAWSEFPAGPPLLEATRAAPSTSGSTGEAPPVFAQAASDQIIYVGYEPPHHSARRSWCPRTAQSPRSPN